MQHICKRLGRTNTPRTGDRHNSGMTEQVHASSPCRPPVPSLSWLLQMQPPQIWSLKVWWASAGMGQAALPGLLAAICWRTQQTAWWWWRTSKHGSAGGPAHTTPRLAPAAAPLRRSALLSGHQLFSCCSAGLSSSAVRSHQLRRAQEGWLQLLPPALLTQPPHCALQVSASANHAAQPHITLRLPPVQVALQPLSGRELRGAGPCLWGGSLRPACRWGACRRHLPVGPGPRRVHARPDRAHPRRAGAADCQSAAGVPTVCLHSSSPAHTVPVPPT